MEKITKKSADKSGKKLKKNKHLNSFQVIILGFFSLILLGALILMLPISSRERVVTPFADCLFTAISASCVTGLVVRDTATYWSFFGQLIILTLIQIGGMGVITIGLAIMRLSGKKIGLSTRSTMQDSISAPQVGGIVRLTGFILKSSMIIELAGAALLMPVFCRDFGFPKGLWYSVWHSVSAFCNAGFDLMGVREKFSSLCSYHDDIYVNIIIMLLIVVGGIGFLVWNDVLTHRLHFKKYSLQSKMVLTTTLLLIFLPAIYFFFGEYDELPMCDRILSSLFQSITARTAGFNTQDLAQMNEAGTLVMIMLMLVGGSPGSTAGGMKTATLAVLFVSAITVFSRRNDAQCFGRRLQEDSARNAAAVLFTYLSLFISTGMVISRVENIPLLTCLFETGSAIGTAGLTMGITTALTLGSRILLMCLMFFGRVGPLTLIYAAVPSTETGKSKMPMERVSIG